LKKYCDAYGFKYVYLLENSKEGLVFLLDTEKLDSNHDNIFLNTYDVPEELFNKVLKKYHPELIENQQIEITYEYTDEYGTFISAFVPIIRNDEVVSIIGIDYDEKLILSLERMVTTEIILSLVITIILLIILTIIISKTFVNFVRKIDELNKYLINANKQLEELSTTDELTKLDNRRSFLEYIDMIWKQCHRLNLPLSIIMIDIDYFKKYNDSLGHLEGDNVIIAVAQCLKSNLKRETDFVARFGGEEFVCLLPYIKNTEAMVIADELVKNVENIKLPHPSNGCSKYVTISAGMSSIVPAENITYKQLLDEADKALYMAKQSGRNRIIAY